jgi:hypothetical protein
MDVYEKESILKSLRNTAVNTKKECIAILNNFTMNSKILCFLPAHDKNDMNDEVINEILNLLNNFTENLFNKSSKEECIQFRSKLEECNYFNTLFLLLNIYKNMSFKVRISILLGNFCKYIVITNKEKIIIDILIDYLKTQSIKKSNKDENNKLIMNVLDTLVCVTVEVDKNRKILLDSGIIQLLLPFVNSSDTNVWGETLVLLNNICLVEYFDDKNSIINCGIFDVFHKKLLEISPSPPQKMISSNYHSIIHIILGIDNLLISNTSGVTSFLKTPLIPLLLHTLDSTISIGNTSSDQNIGNIQLYICKCFLKCVKHCYENTLLLVEMKVIDSLLNIIEMYINKIKKRKYY